MNTSQIMRIISFLFNLTFIFCQEFREKNYHIINGLKISQTYRTLSGIVSTTRCAMRCLEVNYCTSANYNGAANQCELTQHSPEDGSVNIIEDQTWKIIFIKNQLWNLVFRATAGIGIPTYSAYMGTATLPTPSDACMLPQTTNCTTHYRDSDVIDSWNSHNIQQVKFVLYKAGMAVVDIIFINSALDTKTSWFSADHIINSSFVDLNSTTTCNYFGISGADHLHRRFYINEVWYGCPGDAGWVCVFDLDLSGSSAAICPFETGLIYPYFAYLPNNNKGFFATGLQGADVLAIYTKS